MEILCYLGLNEEVGKLPGQNEKKTFYCKGSPFSLVGQLLNAH